MIIYKAISTSESEKGNINISFGIHTSPFGLCIIGITKKRVCHLSFTNSKKADSAAKDILLNWPVAEIVRDQVVTKKYVDMIFAVGKKKTIKSLHLLIKGTKFQIKVWEALLTIPQGKTVSYKEVARMIGLPKAVRAVGTACGKNTIGFLIPCHRVVPSSGGLGRYRWGLNRKKAMLSFESDIKK